MRKEKVWTKLRCPISLGNFYKTQNLTLTGFRNGSDRLDNTRKLSVNYKEFNIPIYSKYLAMIFFAKDVNIVLELLEREIKQNIGIELGIL